jgi:hypothetical protein
MIAKPLTSSLKLIIGILQDNLKTCAFCAHSDNFASGRLEIGRTGAHPPESTPGDRSRPLPAHATARDDKKTREKSRGQTRLARWSRDNQPHRSSLNFENTERDEVGTQNNDHVALIIRLC